MAKLTFQGLDAYTAKLSRLSAMASEQVIGSAVYSGAEVAADAVRQQLSSIPTDERWGTESWPKAGIRAEEKQGLLDSFGVTPLRNDGGFLNVKLGFDGYQGKPTRNYPRGLPNQLLARAVESGTSFMRATPFLKESIRKCRKPAQQAMEKKLDQEIEKIMD